MSFVPDRKPSSPAIEALQAIGHDIHKGEVILGEGPLRNTGEFEVAIHLHADVQTSVKVIVVGEKK